MNLRQITPGLPYHNLRTVLSLSLCFAATRATASSRENRRLCVKLPYLADYRLLRSSCTIAPLGFVKITFRGFSISGSSRSASPRQALLNNFFRLFKFWERRAATSRFAEGLQVPYCFYAPPPQ